jgi:nitrite reductase (NADH) large subunit
VEALIRSVHGDAATGPSVKPLCDCTPLSREQVVAEIRDKHLLAVKEVMNVLGWEGEGCAVCRPAINYFLTMCWPGENEDDPRSRFVNERVHANIQRDGTFSVVPRIYGGVTTPEELMRIARVAQRYKVPTVKITGGQRIDLLGVKKEDLPAMWDELGLPSGFAYAKAVRTVKTCVGSDYCRFGTRDSMGMGIRIERMFENLWTPAKVKMAVNACPRNCAESLIKDVGLIGVEKAWEIYVGGNGGVKVRSAELLAAVETDDEALDLIAAFLQLYREDANYNERTSVWCERVGIEWLRRELVENTERRAALTARMNHALEGRVDPWMERARRAREGDTLVLSEFTPLATV